MVTFRVSRAQREDAEREAERLGVSVNKLARQRFLGVADACVDTVESTRGETTGRGLTVVYDSDADPNPAIGED